MKVNQSTVYDYLECVNSSRHAGCRRSSWGCNGSSRYIPRRNYSPIEVEVLEGSGKIMLTGNLGDVMKESAMQLLHTLEGTEMYLASPKTFIRKSTFTSMLRRQPYQKMGHQLELQ